MGSHHYTVCTNPECMAGSKTLDVEIPCPHCRDGRRIRDPKVPSLLVRGTGGEVVSIIPVHSPGMVEKTMSGLLRNMDTDRYYIDDSEFD